MSKYDKIDKKKIVDPKYVTPTTITLRAFILFLDMCQIIPVGHKL